MKPNLRDRVGQRVILAGEIIDTDRENCLVRFDDDTRPAGWAVWVHHSITQEDTP
jgi:hypothetical protein